MDAVISEVFATAGNATAWTRTNLGATTEVTHGSYTWTVVLPASSEPTKARVTGRHGYGGTEYPQAEATWGQTLRIVEAAQSALRIH